jgi:hypothetical protein
MCLEGGDARGAGRGAGARGHAPLLRCAAPAPLSLDGERPRLRCTHPPPLSNTHTHTHTHTRTRQAGGASSCDGLCKSALDIPINAYDQRTEICFGSVGEVRRFEEYLYGERACVCESMCVCVAVVRVCVCVCVSVCARVCAVMRRWQLHRHTRAPRAVPVSQEQWCACACLTLLPHTPHSCSPQATPPATAPPTSWRPTPASEQLPVAAAAGAAAMAWALS